MITSWRSYWAYYNIRLNQVHFFPNLREYDDPNFELLGEYRSHYKPVNEHAEWAVQRLKMLGMHDPSRPMGFIEHPC